MLVTDSYRIHLFLAPGTVCVSYSAIASFTPLPLSCLACDVDIPEPRRSILAVEGFHLNVSDLLPALNHFSRRFLLSVALFGLNAIALAQTLPYARPEFTDPNRKSAVEAVLPEIDEVFSDLARTEHFPGLVYGVVLDGRLIHSRALGFANLERKLATSSDTGFRIASMTKSFVSMAIFKLRDDGKVSLDDPVSKYLPEFRNVRPPTSDSTPVTVRNLMTMTTGLPEDNPWGDRQMAISQEDLRKFVSGGLSFSNPPGQQYEYSNLGFVLLGQVVSKASGVPFQKYITREILLPLGMTHTVWEYSEVPPANFALGYRWERDTWTPEPIIHDGEGAACGGLITTLDDFSRYVGFHLAAWPARDEPDSGPVRRATVRELQRPFVVASFNSRATLLDGSTPNPGVSFYGNGLSWSIDSRQVISLAHSGGLPGYGSNYRFLPDYNVAVIAFANRTYAPAGRGCSRAINVLLEHASLKPRTLPPSPILQTRARQLQDLIVSWDTKLGDETVAGNFFLDKSREDWIAFAQETLARAGRIASTTPVAPENQLRGTFSLKGEYGSVKVHFTLTPEQVPKVQELSLDFQSPQ
jgi:CubicO group peptidase (beta-lactamase class C family)